MATNGTTRRLLQHAQAVRVFIGLGAAIGVVTALLVIAQAELLSSTVARAFLGGAGLAELAVPLVALLGVVEGRAALGWGGEVTAQRAAAGAAVQLRAAVLDHVPRLGPRHPGLPSTAELATLASRGVDGVDGYVGRSLRQLVAGAMVPLVVAVRILTADWVSALVVGVTVPLIPLFMVLIGLHTKARPVLLLDGPTARLDADTAAVVCADLLRVTTGRTALVVTHRPQELPGLPRVCLPTRHDAPAGVAPLT